ncbi:MAG TPA: dioxygenase [Mycobacteriales bacterium]|nr:dioxygenase [Mycobacteriales bacterium]
MTTDGTTPPTTNPADLLDEVLARLAGTPDPRLLGLMTALVTHLHAFACDVRLTEAEWAAGIRFLTEIGQLSDDNRQEFVLASDTLGVSMLVDLLANDASSGATESTVLGPFYVPGSPERPNGTSTAERPSGDPAFVSGRVLSADGAPIGGARVDVWQNGADMLYAVQDPDAPSSNLRGVFTTDAAGRFSFIGVRPVDYPIPADGPVGRMLAATGRHPWRAAHLHVIVSADGFRSVTTHLFDDGSRYLDSDAVFGVKPSLIKHFTLHPAGSADPPPGIATHQQWYSVSQDFVLDRN